MSQLETLNTMVKLDDEAREFIINTSIYFYQGNTRINIIDYFPYLKQGYTKVYMLDDFEEYYIKKGIEYPTDFHMMYENNIVINDNVLIQAIQNECNILSSILHIASRSDKLSDLIFNDAAGNISLLLLADSNVKLYTAIYLKNKELVDVFLNEIDPRFDNNEAYHIAKRIGNRDIIEAVKNKIIQLNMLYDMVLQTQLVGYEQIGQDIRLSKYV
jgi:hypothetical protein